MSDNDSRQRVDWGSFSKTLFWFLVFGAFFGISSGEAVPFILSLITGIIVAFFFAVEPNEDTSEWKSVNTQNGAKKKEGRKGSEGGKYGAGQAENDLGKVVEYDGFARKEGGVARLKTDEPIVTGDLIEFRSNRTDFTQEIEKVRTKGKGTKEVALKGEVSLKVDKRVEVGARVYLVSKENRPADAKERILKERENQEDKEVEEEESKQKGIEKSGEGRKAEEENESRKKDQEKEQTYVEDEGIGKVQNYYSLADKTGGVAKLTIEEDLAVGDVIRFKGPETDIVQKIRQLRPDGTETATFVSGDHTSLRVYEAVNEGAIVKVESKIQRPIESVEKGTNESQPPFSSESNEWSKNEGQKLGKITNYWNLANNEGGLAKVKIWKEINKGDGVHFYGENTDFVQTIELIKHHGKEVLNAAKGKKFEIRVKKRVRVGDVILSIATTSSNNKNESQKTKTKKEDKEKQVEDEEPPEERRSRSNSLLGEKEKIGGLEKEDEDNSEKEAEQEFRSIAPPRQDEGVQLSDEEMPEGAGSIEETEEENSTPKREVEERPESKFLNRRAVKKTHLERLRERLLDEVLSQKSSFETSSRKVEEESSAEKSEDDVRENLRLSTQVSAKCFNKSIQELRNQLLNSLLDVGSLDQKEGKRREPPEKGSREHIDFSTNGNGSKKSGEFWSRWSNRVEKLEPNSFRSETNPIEDTEQEITGQNNGVNSTVQNYFNSINTDIYSKREEREVARRVDQGDENARREFIKHNLRLPIDIAKRYRWANVRFEDLIQAGNEGLIQAVDRFDPEQGNKFSTYATYWVKQRISRFAQRSRLIRLPAHIQGLQRKINQLTQSNNRDKELKKDELAQKFDTSVKNITRALKHEEELRSLDREMQVNYPDETGTRLSSKRLNEVKILKKSGLVDSYYQFDEFGTEIRWKYDFAETVKDLEFTHHSNHMWQVAKRELRNVLKNELSDRQYRIMLMRYGFEESEKTLEEVGKVFGISRERVRQLQNAAIEDLQDLKWIDRFRDLKNNYERWETVNRYELTKPWPTLGEDDLQ